MNTSINVLFVNDSDDDTTLMVRELKRNNFDVLFERVGSYKHMSKVLEKREWDVVICDYFMPEFDGIRAMKLLRDMNYNLPFILISSSFCEHIAVETIEAGADDFITKENLSRLPFAVKRELKEYQEKKELKRLNEAIQTLVKSTVIKTGDDAFRKIILNVKEWLDCDYVCLGQCIENDNVKALSMVINEIYKCDCINNIKGTLCEIVIRDGFCYYPEGSAKLLPYSCEQCTNIKAEGFVGMSICDETGKTIGLLWAVSSRYLTLPPRAKNIMEIITAKAGSEIERLQAEEQLHKLSYAVEQSSSVVVITDTEGAIEYVNPMFTKVTGYSLEDSIGQNPNILKSGITTEDEYKRLWDTILHGKEWHGEFCNKKKNGDLYWEAVSISPVRSKKGNITNFIAIAEDITDHKKMEETIRQQNENLETLVKERTDRIMALEHQRMENEKLVALGQMSATVAHEINNPLSCIKGSFMLIKDSIPKGSKYYEYVDIIEKEIVRISRIVQQMFNLSRPYQGEICEFDLIVIIRDIIKMLKKYCDEHSVIISFKDHDDIVKVTMSEDYFRQILYNIIKNAIEASYEGGRVDVKVKTFNDKFNVIVADQGEGMSKKIRSRIFEPFFSTKSKYSNSGMGLGLATTKAIVESMGGSISCFSEKGKGTTFIIDLPINLIE